MFCEHGNGMNNQQWKKRGGGGGGGNKHPPQRRRTQSLAHTTFFDAPLFLLISQGKKLCYFKQTD